VVVRSNEPARARVIDRQGNRAQPIERRIVIR
jgi:hypothetical protein